jgi:hypothetical protein
MRRILCSLAAALTFTISGLALAPAHAQTKTQVLNVNEPIPARVTLSIGERLMVWTEVIPGNATIASVTCTDDDGKGSPTLEPVPGFYPNSTLKAVQSGSCVLTISYTYRPRDPSATLQSTTVVTVTP